MNTKQTSTVVNKASETNLLLAAKLGETEPTNRLKIRVGLGPKDRPDPTAVDMLAEILAEWDEFTAAIDAFNAAAEGPERSALDADARTALAVFRGAVRDARDQFANACGCGCECNAPGSAVFDPIAQLHRIVRAVHVQEAYLASAAVREEPTEALQLCMTQDAMEAARQAMRLWADACKRAAHDVARDLKRRGYKVFTADGQPFPETTVGANARLMSSCIA